MKKAGSKLILLGALALALLGALIAKIAGLFQAQPRAVAGEGDAASSGRAAMTSRGADRGEGKDKPKEGLAARDEGVGPRDEGLGEKEVSASLQASASFAPLRELPSLQVGKGLPRAFALEAGGSFLVGARKEVRRVAAGGGVETLFSLPEDISALAVSPGGRIYAATSSRLFSWAEGSLREWAGQGPGGLVVGMALDAEKGDLYCADAGSKLVYRYSAEGRLLKIIGAADEEAGIPGFIVPSPYFSIAFARGELYAANPGRHGIERYDREGRLISAFYKPSHGAEGFSGCCNPACIFITAEGEILSYEKGLGRVKLLSAEGELKETLLDGERAVMSFLGAQVLGLGEGGIALLDREAGEIRIFSRGES